MAREIHASAQDGINFEEARTSVRDSMRRLYPMHVYASEDIQRQGKLIVISYTYKYSRWKHYRSTVMNRLRRIMGKQADSVEAQP